MTLPGLWHQDPATQHVGPIQVETVASGWVVSCPDSAGTTFAEFDTRQGPVETPVFGDFFTDFTSVYDGNTDLCSGWYLMLIPQYVMSGVGPELPWPAGAINYEFEDPEGHDGTVRWRVGWEVTISYGPGYESGDPGFGGVWDGGVVLRAPAALVGFDPVLGDYPPLMTRSVLQGLDVLQELPARADGVADDPHFGLVDVTVPMGDGIVFIGNNLLAGVAAYRGPAIGANQTAEDASIGFAGDFYSPEDKPGNVESRDHALLDGDYVPSRWRFLFTDPITGANLHPLRQRRRDW